MRSLLSRTKGVVEADIRFFSQKYILKLLSVIWSVKGKFYHIKES